MREQIEAAATLLLIPGAWTTEAEARDSKDHWADYDDSTACKWCAIGALRRASIDMESLNELSQLHASKYGMYISTFNDTVAETAEQVAERLFELAQEY